MKKFSYKRHPNPDCSCGGRAVKHGLLKNLSNTVQRYRCLVCNTRFLVSDDYSINTEPSPIFKHPGYAATSCVMLVSDRLLALIDTEDEHIAAGHIWRANNGPRPYAVTAIKNKGVLLHTLIITAAERDHKNGNPLDNRKINLRACTHQQNSMNRGPNHGRRFKGIDKRPSGRFRAKININRVNRYIGDYATAEEAASAYDRTALELFGEFAWLNFPQKRSEYMQTLQCKTRQSSLT